MMQINNTNWRDIVALNAVSTLAQLGQFGVGYVVLPIWLAARGYGALQLGLFSAFSWAGMLLGILLAPKLIVQFDSKKIVFTSLLISSLGFVLMPLGTSTFWLLSSPLIGLGLGLRWIANETWLYRIVPKEVLGQVVGTHEALIALAVIIAPALAAWLGVQGNAMIWLAILFNLLATLPLLFVATAKGQKVDPPKLQFFQVDQLTKLAMVIAGAGGLVDGAMMALFPLFGLGRGFSEAQIALLLTSIGVGGLVLQYPLGWFSDKSGVIPAGLLAAVIACAVTCVMAFVPMEFNGFASASFVFGGTTAAFLTFGIIAAASAQDHDHMAENMSRISIAFTVCSIAGSLLAGLAAERLDSDAILWLVALVSAALAAVFALHSAEEK